MSQPIPLTARQKIAVLLVALGPDSAGEILRHLDDAHAETIAQAITELGSVTSELEDAILEEFEQLLSSGARLEEGGEVFARGALEEAFGSDRAAELMGHLRDQKTTGFRLLGDADPDELAALVLKEHPQAGALILSLLPPERAAAVFDRLPPERQSDIAYRMSTTRQIDPTVLQDLEAALADELSTALEQRATRAGGVDVVSDMLSHLPESTESSVLAGIDARSAELGESIRNRLHTFEDICLLPQKEVQLVLREVDSEDLLLALRGAGDNVRGHLKACMTSRAWKRLEEDIEAMGRVRLSEIEGARIRITQILRGLAHDGQVHLVRAGSPGDFI